MNVNAKLYLELCKSLNDNSLFRSYELFLNNTNEFYTEQEDENSYLLFHKKFVLRVESEIILDNQESDSGTWVREYNVYNVTNQYVNTDHYISNGEINKIVENLSLDNLLGKLS